MNAPASPPSPTPGAEAGAALCIVAALSLELRPLLRRATHLSLVPSPQGAWVWQGLLGGRPVLIVRSGMGARGVARVLPVLDALDLSAVVSVGACAALKDGLGQGDVVAAERVVSEEGASFVCAAPMLKAVGEAGVKAHRGALACSGHVLSEPALKRELHRRCGALAADMESAHLAAYAKRRGLPFAALKVVSDEAGCWMPPLDARGWLAHPLWRALRLPRYLGGLLRVAKGWPKVREGLEAAALALERLSASGSLRP